MTAFGQNAKPTAKKHTGLIGHSVDKADAGYYGMAGCGLGSVLFGESESRGGQILAATTNGVYSNNTFGMSSGTSNCVPEKAAHAAEVKKNMDLFIAANREALANDVVKSNGDTLTAMSEIIGCKDSAYLGAKLQSRYETIFKSKVDQDVSNNMFETVTHDRYLVENCKL
jgi:Protein of unknown function (DUF3015)